MAVEALTTKQILDGPVSREFILIGGRDGVGKTTSVITLAKYVEEIVDPKAKFYIIDTENGVRKILRAFGAQAPKNIIYYQVQNMMEAIEALDDLDSTLKPGDWIAVESMARLWEYSQDAAYQAVAGMSKAEFLAKRSDGGRGGAPIPQPDQFWQLTKNLHNARFLDILNNSNDYNVVLVTTLAKDSPFKEQRTSDRTKFKRQFGIDSGFGGIPNLPYYPDTVLLMDQTDGSVDCSVLKDRGVLNMEGKRIVFDVDTPLDFAVSFMSECGRLG